MIDLTRRAGGPLRIGHRGAPALAPENTLRSFRAARDAGVDLIEFDVIAVRGRDLVVAHSPDLREVSHGAVRGSVHDHSLDRLRELCPELPTLEEALEFFVHEAPDVGVLLDLKVARSCDEVLSALRRFGLLERSLVSSFHLRALRSLASLEPRLRTGVSFPRDPLRIHGRRRSAPVVRQALLALRRVAPRFASKLLAASRARTLVVHHVIVSRALVRRAHALGVPVVAWTVDELDDLRRVDEAGVDAVVANDPTIFVSTLPT